MANELNKALWISVGGILGTLATCYLVGRIQDNMALDREYEDMLARANARTAKLREAAARAVKAQIRITVTHGFGGADEVIALSPAELEKLQSIMPHLESAPLPERAVWKRRRHGLSNRVKSPSFYLYLANLEFLDAEGHLLDELMLNQPIARAENAGAYRRSGCSAAYMLPTDELERFEALPGVLAARTYKPH
ncbi:MAG: hypothetical protein Q4F38_09880 [Akkermansia sp.]|nr:hypothetical protein [Akkermansia sp.]